MRRPLALIGVLGATVLCVSGIAGAVGTATNRGFQRPDWRGVARLLGRRPPSGTSRAILIQHYRDLLPLSLYEPGLRFMKADGATVQEFDVVSFTAPRVHLCVWGAACNLSGTRMQRAYRLKGFRVLWRRHIYQFTVLHMVSSQPLRLTPGAVSRALTSTRLAKDELLIQR